MGSEASRGAQAKGKTISQGKPRNRPCIPSPLDEPLVPESPSGSAQKIEAAPKEEPGEVAQIRPTAIPREAEDQSCVGGEEARTRTIVDETESPETAAQSGCVSGAKNGSKRLSYVETMDGRSPYTFVEMLLLRQETQSQDTHKRPSQPALKGRERLRSQSCSCLQSMQLRQGRTTTVQQTERTVATKPFSPMCGTVSPAYQ